MTGGARGPGVFFIIPCVDTYVKIDMRSMTFEIPPQEVRMSITKPNQTKLPREEAKNPMLGRQNEIFTKIGWLSLQLSIHLF